MEARAPAVLLLTLTLTLTGFMCSGVSSYGAISIVDRHVRLLRSAFPTGGIFEFTKHPNVPDAPVLEGHQVTVTCDTNSPSNIHWTINDETIVNSSRRHFKSAGSTSTLTITRALRIDSGAIRCVATSISGQVIKSKDGLLDVTWLDYPTIELEHPGNINDITEGIDVQLNCEADIGNGDVQYHWFRNSERITSKMQRIDLKKKKLHILKISAKDNGIYRCNIHFGGEIRESKINFLLIVKDSKLPHIIHIPSDLLLAPKSFAIFHCQYKDADVIEWFKNEMNTPLDNNERITIHKNHSLTIKNITKRDEGFYSCVAYKNNEKTQLQRFSVKLKIAYIKPIMIFDFEPQLSENRVVIAQEGKSYVLTCIGSRDNNPPSQIMWKNPEQHLVSDKGEVRVDDGSLIIDNVKKSHQGVYTCASENLAGIQEITIYLVINPIPTITKNPSKVTVDENLSSFFKCEVTIEKQKTLNSNLKSFWNKIITLSYLKTVNGKPHHSKKHNGEREFPLHMGNFSTLYEMDADESGNADTIVPLNKEQLIDKWFNNFNWDLYELKWKKDSGKIIKDDQDHIMIIPRDGILKFVKTVLSDRGNYWCEVITSAGDVIKSPSVHLTITEKLKFSPPPVSKKLELYSSDKIHCRVQGTPTPNITWYRDFNDSLPEDVQSINGTIQFTEVTRVHRGNYTCVAMNIQGTIQASILIDVIVSPRFISPLPSQIIDVSEGDPVWIDCIAEGDPEPKTQWDRNSNIIATVKNDDKSTPIIGDAINRGSGINENERIYLLDNGTLHIKSTRLEDSDQYGCMAGSSAGLRRQEVTLVVHSINGLQVENEDGVITKAIFITMSVVGAYMLLVIGLMVWCRVRRRRKLARNLANEKLENGELELKDKDGPNDKLIENNDDIMSMDANKYCQIKNAKNKCNGSGNLKAKNGNIMGKSKGSNENCGNTTGGESGQNMSDNSEMSANSKASKKGFGINSRYDKISMTRNLLHDLVSLGRGEFGDVLVAKYLNPKHIHNPTIEEIELLNGDTTALTDAEEIGENDPIDTSTAKKDDSTKYVMVKSLLHTKDESHLAEFKRELDMFSKLKHENVSELIGLCNEIEPHYLVFEYTDWGGLKQFLLATRTEEEILIQREIDKTSNRIEESQSKTVVSGRTTPLLVPQILTLAHQISKGMEYIADNRLIHKDLATRNCLISSKFIAKISIPSLTKDAHSKEYYKHINQVIPLRWLPYECVFESDYTTKSDVYMFACTIWELFFKAELPFIKMSDSTVLSHLKNNTLSWKTHDDMPASLAELLEKCWDTSIKKRPTFNETTRQIAKILKESTVST